MKQKNVILMVIAVGCGLVAAFLTSQMSAKGQVEQVEVIVAAKDLPVGTTITREELKNLVKIKTMPKDGLPPAYVTNMDDLVDKRLSRPLRAEESFNPQDLLKGGAITLPPGYNMVSLPVGVGQAAAGFVGPGSRVDVLATVRSANQLKAFPLLVNMLIVAVDTQTTYKSDNGGVFPSLSMVSFAVKGKEALVLSLAKSRGCSLELMLRHPETSNQTESNDDKLENVIRLLSSDTDQARVVDGSADNPDGPNGKPVIKPVDPKPVDPKLVDDKKPVEPPVAPAPSIAVVKVLVAKRDIEPNTVLTNDLIADSFEWKELPKDFATDALTDLSTGLGHAFKTGVAKGQWVTWFMVGVQTPKAPPQDKFSIPKPSETDPGQPVKWKYHDVAVHSPSGTRIHRYVEVAPGEWRFFAEMSPQQAAKFDREEKEKQKPEAKPEAKPDAKPDAQPDAKKID